MAVAEPDLDIGHVETVLDALTEACYYLTVERNRYHFSFKENLNKRYADRRANIKDGTISDRVRTEIETVFAANTGISPIFFPENSGKIPDKPALTFVVLTPEQSTEDEKRTKAFIENVDPRARHCWTNVQERALFAVVQLTSQLCEDGTAAARVAGNLSRNCRRSALDTQVAQLCDNIKKAKPRSSESVWRSYNNVALLGKNNEVRFIDLGKAHSSAAAAHHSVHL